MADTQWHSINDTLKGIAGLTGLEIAKSAEQLSTTDVSQLGAQIAQFCISALTLYSLIKSIFFTKK